MDVLEKALVKQELKSKRGCPSGEHKHGGADYCHPINQKHHEGWKEVDWGKVWGKGVVKPK